MINKIIASSDERASTLLTPDYFFINLEGKKS